MLQQLLKNIHNAPSLEYVSFSETAIRLMNMENLHISLAKLKTVALDGVAIYKDDNVSDIKHISPKALESFSMRDLYSDDAVDIMETDMVCNWVPYISASYSSLQELNLMSEVDVDGSELIELGKASMDKAWTSAMTTLTQINSFRSNVCTLSKSILEVMDTNDIQLNRLRVKIEDGVLKSLESPRSLTDLQTLEIS